LSAYSRNYTLELGGQTLQLDYYGKNHSLGNTFIYAPEHRTLMLVDIVFPGWVPYPYLAVTIDVAGFVKAHDIALNNYDFDTFVGRHLTRLGSREDVQIQSEFISDLVSASARANQEITFREIAAEVGRFDNPWLIFSRYNDAINEQCAGEMLSKWKNRLGGTEQFTDEHCFTMSEALRIDPTVALTQDSAFVYK
jgi:hypothetical protein